MVDWDLVPSGGPEGDDDCTPEQGTDEGRSYPAISDCVMKQYLSKSYKKNYETKSINGPGVNTFSCSKNTKQARCRYCGSITVHWEKRADKWILFDDTTTLSHSCEEYFAMKGLFNE